MPIPPPAPTPPPSSPPPQDRLGAVRVHRHLRVCPISFRERQ
jgi:hypothetical protein